MTIQFYFHVCCNAEKFSGNGITAYLACVNAIGQKRADALIRNTKQGKYFVGDQEVFGDNQSGVSDIKSKNGITVASVTRLVSTDNLTDEEKEVRRLKQIKRNYPC